MAIKSWERQVGEPIIGFRAFESFLYNPDRPKPRADSLSGKKDWFRQFTWLERSRQFDADLVEKRQQVSQLALKDRADELVLSADSLIQTQLDQAMFDPAKVGEWDENGHFKLFPTDKIPVRMRRVMFQNLRITSRKDGPPTTTMVLASQSARQNALKNLGENQGVWGVKDAGAGSLNLKDQYQMFLTLAANNKLDSLIEWAEKNTLPTEKIEVREIADAEIISDESDIVLPTKPSGPYFPPIDRSTEG